VKIFKGKHAIANLSIFERGVSNMKPVGLSTYSQKLIKQGGCDRKRNPERGLAGGGLSSNASHFCWEKKGRG